MINDRLVALMGVGLLHSTVLAEVDLMESRGIRLNAVRFKFYIIPGPQRDRATAPCAPSECSFSRPQRLPNETGSSETLHRRA